MERQQLGASDLESSRIIYGVMGIGRAWQAVDAGEADAMRVGQDRILQAFDAGINHFDTADIYGGGTSDEILGAALRARPGLRDQVIVTTKCCVRRLERPVVGAGEWYDMSGRYVRTSVEAALKRLDMDVIDVFLMHRPDILVELEELAATFEDLHGQGKVRHFGVSNFFPHQVALLQKYLPMKLVANQVPIHPLDPDRFYDGTMEQCIMAKTTPTAFSPIARGIFGTGGLPPGGHPRSEDVGKVIDVFDAMAWRYGVTRTQITLGWLLRHPAGVLPIIGTTRADRIAESVQAVSIELTREDWHRLTSAACWYAGYDKGTGRKKSGR